MKKRKQKQDNNITSIILNTQQRNKERKSEIERQICKTGKIRTLDTTKNIHTQNTKSIFNQQIEKRKHTKVKYKSKRCRTQQFVRKKQTNNNSRQPPTNRN